MNVILLEPKAIVSWQDKLLVAILTFKFFSSHWPIFLEFIDTAGTTSNSELTWHVAVLEACKVFLHLVINGSSQIMGRKSDGKTGFFQRVMFLHKGSDFSRLRSLLPRALSDCITSLTTDGVPKRITIKKQKDHIAIPLLHCWYYQMHLARHLSENKATEYTTRLICNKKHNLKGWGQSTLKVLVGQVTLNLNLLCWCAVSQIFYLLLTAAL